MKLEGKTAIITGGTKGIGLGCARVFATHGCKVVIASQDEEHGNSVAAEMRAEGLDTRFIACDVRDEEAMKSLVARTVSQFGWLDCFLNNAGWHPPAMTIGETSIEDFENLLRLNLTSTFMGCKFAVPELVKTRGSIINMSSKVGEIGQEAAPAYVATKAGQIGLTKALAVDLAPVGVRVNAVAPAGVMTPLMEDWASSQYDPAAALRTVDGWHPLGRMATIEEIGEVCAFLASAEAAFLTGQVICPDGGAALGYRS
jgi:L-fucose dehydrogenase